LEIGSVAQDIRAIISGNDSDCIARKGVGGRMEEEIDIARRQESQDRSRRDDSSAD
jgi:hypothetical protein